MSLLQPPGLNHARPKDTTTQSPTVGVKFPQASPFSMNNPLALSECLQQLKVVRYAVSTAKAS